MSEPSEYIVVGSGCTGAMAAQTLVEAGKQVTMLDAGLQNDRYDTVLPDKAFLDIRRSEPDQYRYFLGDDAEGVAWGKVGKGEQITPPRKHIMQLVDTFLPVTSENFDPMESLGYGGLGIGWGLGCWEFSQPELRAAGFNTAAMRRAYQVVSDRIGISATRDDAAAYALGTLRGYQPSPDMDHNHQRLFAAYQKHKSLMRSRGFVMGRTPLALITKDFQGRKAYAYNGMDFYSDRDRSAYRPWMTIDALRQRKNFTFHGNLLVTRFIEKPAYTEVVCLDITTRKQRVFRCKRLVLAPGILGSARIVLRSLGQRGTRLPLLCNPYSYIPCIQLGLMGQAAEQHKLGFAQLSLFLDETGDMSDVAMASLYSYQSLMLFRMVRQAPLNFRDAGILMRYLQSGMVIMGLHQPDRPADSKYMELTAATDSPTGDTLRISYTATPAEVRSRHRRETAYVRAMRRMGAYAVKRIDPGFGSSIHYAGCLPFSSAEEPFTLDHDGRLHGTRAVYVADGSGFRFLPAKGLTFTLLANAHRVAGALVGQK